jgi:hypothetical protein
MRHPESPKQDDAVPETTEPNDNNDKTRTGRQRPHPLQTAQECGTRKGNTKTDFLKPITVGFGVCV